MEVMGMNRRARRALAKMNGVKKFGGSMKPYVGAKVKQKENESERK